MSQADETFFTSIGCMDGRVQEPVLAFGQKKLGVKYADTITEAGLVGILAGNPEDKLLKALKFKINISIEKHHSKGIIVHGHQECAGNPVLDDKHREDVRKSVGVIKSLINSSIFAVGVFVKRSLQDSSKWEIEEV